jgi:glycosyltransferase involved in cell wall biosynthesis
MNILLENVNLKSNSGPNSFGQKLFKYMSKNGHSFGQGAWPNAELRLCFIESHMRASPKIPMVTRLDGIYFNILQNYKQQNANILKTYNNSDGIIFQSNFNKELITKYFGLHNNTQVIHNGADMDLISKIETPPVEKDVENVWCCASSWRPHKRLKENIRYFQEHSGAKDILVVAGGGYKPQDIVRDKKIFYTGNLSTEHLISLYKRSKYFIHLAWLDHCPNVVVDARASGCQIICSSTGGTREISGKDAIVIKEDVWGFDPVNLYNPPQLNFDNKVNNEWDIDYTMDYCSIKYEEYLSSHLK